MVLCAERIRVAAYFRWLRRGEAHGQDVRDWIAAEQDLIFAEHYEVIARYRLDGIATRVLGDGVRPRRCRFCEQAEPRAEFPMPVPALPPALGNAALFTAEVCAECEANYRDGVADDLERFLRPYLGGEAGPTLPVYRPIAACKGLVRAALVLLPEAELQYVEDAVDWVGNPDHRHDGAAFGAPECAVFATEGPAPFSWAALARRRDDEASVPYLLFFVGTGKAVFQVHLPLCERDADLDGEGLVIPRVAWPFGPTPWGEAGGPWIVALAAAGPRRGPGDRAYRIAG